MQIASAHATKCTCSHTPPTSTFCSPTFPINQPSSRAVTTDHVQQFLDILKSLSAKEGPPPPPPAAADKVKSEERPARASKLELKTVDEVWDAKAYEYKVVESITPPDEENELDQYIFVVRTRIDKKTEKRTHYIDLKSEGLRDVLRSVLQDVKGICLREEKPSVEQNLLFHYLPDLEAYRSNHAALDDSTLRHLDLLLDFIKKTYQSTTERLSALLEKHEITYDLLWALFKPNAIVYTTCVGTDKPRCVKYDFGEERKQMNGVEYFHVGCHYLDSDGKVFGEVSTALGIEKFRGTKRINFLGVFPLPYHQKEKETRAYLDKCGRKFLKLINVHHCQYQGMAFYMKKNRPVKLFVNSRIIVDAAYFREANPNYAKPSIDEHNKESSSNHGWLYLGGDDDSEKSSDSVKSNGMEPSDVKGDDLLICSPTVLGFSLGIKLWAEFAVDDVRDIEWQPAALTHLQIPQKKKRAIQALLEAHMKRASSNSFSFDDFIAGKGLGFNVLLHGPPGAGKTLTAEVLSEYFQMPLYAVSTGELGRTAEELEERLPLIFERASKWNALLLLDEADVFLEQRSIGDINRNALVCVFLRTLEYYQGIMFFTTNRVKQIDDAIASRIHFKIKYDNLGLEQRRGVWDYFLGKAATPQGPPVYSRSGLEFLVEKQLNGREIKNLASTAQALALQEGVQVAMSHLEFAIDAGEDFERDVNGAGPKEAMNGYF
ncbi:uncharacterized protein PAC_15933 [Phialocephala subalpina]|uniref:AAA+ ATPase domain-containing protein n=1 Tax=Phialocephala subalpina TaxID=576137 RepID=A0A1L7XLY7_9HELO|nr:uncharacterized protein PAC_15933 [Phialocephala subalpina]